MNIYLDNGYLDFDKILKVGCPFIFLVGSRGTGKTFGAIKYCIENNKKFIFMRRTQTQLEMVTRPEYSPFNAINRELGYHIETVPNTRGFSSDAEILIYDEFIPEIHEKKIKDEFSAFANAYETINRNRELNGRPPLIALCLSNSNSLNNPLLAELDLIDIIQKKQNDGKSEYINPYRGIAVFLINNSIISKQKEETAIYKLTKNTNFFRMAVKNEFAQDYPENIKSMNLAEYNPVVYVKDRFCIYRHKTNKTYYVTEHKRGTPEEFEPSKMDLKRLLKHYKYINIARMRGRVFFETYALQIKFDDIFN